VKNSKSLKNPNIEGHAQIKNKNDQVKVKTNEDAPLKPSKKCESKT
jgi:hypothetical protein